MALIPKPPAENEWAIMDINDLDTIAFFASNNWFQYFDEIDEEEELGVQLAHVLEKMPGLYSIEEDVEVYIVRKHPDKPLNPRIAVFVLENIKTPWGDYAPCIATEGKPGYHLTDWEWSDNFAIAQKLAEEYNVKLGLTKEEAYAIVLGSMKEGE